MREPPRIPEERLRACLQEHYGLEPAMLEFLPRGHDYSAGVYRVVSVQGASYLLKITLRPLYAPSCLVPRYLNEQGVAAVVAPLPTIDQALWTQLDAWTVLVYPFLEGETSLTGMTAAQWQAVGHISQQIHQAPLPPPGFTTLRQEVFAPTVYTDWIHTFETHHLSDALASSGAAHQLSESWLAHQATIQTATTTLVRLAKVLRAHAGPAVICHADLHAANLLRAPTGHVFVIDWDEVMLAPKERDFIFVRAPHAEAFFRGYGETALDWVALTYYRWERVVQDWIENAQNVCFRADLSEASKAVIAQAFDAAWQAPDGNLAAAYAAAAHLAA